MKTVRLTTAQAIVRYLIAQRTVDRRCRAAPLFPGVFAIFGHGNVTCLGLALQEAGDALPTWRGQNEQGMALAAVGFAKAMRPPPDHGGHVARSAPARTNMVTAAGVAHANRLPVLLLAGDTFASRIPDPVLQQVEHFDDPSITVNDAFKPVSRYWDRIMRPEQVVHSLPHAVADDARPGRLRAGVPRPAAGRPGRGVRLPRPVLRADRAPDPPATRRPRASCAGRRRAVQAAAAAADHRRRRRALLAGRGRAGRLRRAPQHPRRRDRRRQGHACSPAHPLNAGPVGVDRLHVSANALAAEADVVLAVGTRLQDFTTGSWTAFADEAASSSASTPPTFDAVKHRALPVVGDAREGLLGARRRGSATGAAATDWVDARRTRDRATTTRTSTRSPARPRRRERPADVRPGDRRRRPAGRSRATTRWPRPAGSPASSTAAGGPRASDFDCEYGFSCMGYEISGAWGAKMAMPDREVIVFVGDGSYLMMNSDLYSSVLSGHKLIVIVCDNGGFAVINRLQVNQGGEPFNNLIADTTHRASWCDVDFAAHAAAMGCDGRDGRRPIAELEAAFERARRSRPHLRDRACKTDRVRLDRGRRVLGGRRAGGQRPRRRSGPPRPRWMPARPANEWGGEDMDGEAIGLDGKVIVVTAARRVSARPWPDWSRRDGAAGIAVIGRDKAEGRDGGGRSSPTSARRRAVRRGRHGRAGRGRAR